MCMVCVNICTCARQAFRGQKAASDPLELEFQAVVSHPTRVLGVTFWSSSTTSTIHSWAISSLSLGLIYFMCMVVWFAHLWGHYFYVWWPWRPEGTGCRGNGAMNGCAPHVGAGNHTWKDSSAPNCWAAPPGLTVTAMVLYSGLFRMRKSYNATSLKFEVFIDSSQKAKLRKQRITCQQIPCFPNSKIMSFWWNTGFRWNSASSTQE